MSLSKETVLALLPQKLCKLSSGGKAPDHPSSGEERLAENLFKALQDLDSEALKCTGKLRVLPARNDGFESIHEALEKVLKRNDELRNDLRRWEEIQDRAMEDYRKDSDKSHAGDMDEEEELEDELEEENEEIEEDEQELIEQQDELKSRRDELALEWEALVSEGKDLAKKLQRAKGRRLQFHAKLETMHRQLLEDRGAPKQEMKQEP